ncbi:hypothetical protein pb186bvf_003982 [Paramecium bursaria]
MEKNLLDKIPFRDDWLFTNINKLINQINQQDKQIDTEQLKQHKITETDSQTIIDELKQVISRNSQDQLYKKIFYQFFLFRLLKLQSYCIINDSLTVLNIFMLNYSTNFIQDFDGSNIYKPAISLFIMVLIQFSKTYCQSNIMQQSNFMIVRIKVILQYLIFTKTQKTLCVGLRSSDSADYVANVNTLLTADIEEISNAKFALEQIFQNIILIGGCFGYLFYIDTKATWMVILVIVIAQAYNLFISNMIVFFEKRLLTNKDDRVSLTTDVIDGMKQIKYLSWENAFSKKIMDVRKKEFKNLVGVKFFYGLVTVFWTNISYILLLIYITNLLSRGIKFENLNIFTLIAIFNTLTFPLGILPWSINQILVSKVSFGRIHEYLCQKEIQKENVFQLPHQTENQYALIIQDITFQWPCGKDSEKIKKEETNNTQVQDSAQDSQTESNNEFQLSINEFGVKNNTINFIIGKIGQGKTALISAIFNEMIQKGQQENQVSKNSLGDSILSQSAEILMSVNGKVVINGKIAYCSQTTWVQNQSIRQNICFGKQFNKDLFDNCVNVCELNRDIDAFPKKDLHEVGPDGKNLSGGQKQRITLARALYQEADIYLFDDIFSSLDIHIADRIFQKAFIQYLLNKGKTIIFITSHYRYLSQVPPSIKSKIFLIENGNIIDEEQTIKDFITQNQTLQEDNSQSDKEDEAINLLLPLGKKQSSMNTKKIQNDKESNQNNDDYEENEEFREQGAISFQTWQSWFKRMSWTLLFLFFVFGLLTQGALSFIDFWLKAELTQQQNWITQFTDLLSSDFSYAFFYLTLISIAITLIQAYLNVFSGLVAAWKMFRDLNQSIMYSLMSFFDVTNQGRIINRVQNDTNVVDNDLPWAFHSLTEYLCRAIGLSIGLAILFPVLSIIIVLVFVLYFKMSQMYSKSNRELKRLHSVNQGKLLSILNESVIGVKTIRAFQKEEYFEQTYLDRLSDSILLDQCSERANFWLQIRLLLLSNLLMFVLVILICFLMQFQFNIEFSQCALGLTYCLITLDCCSDIFEFYVLTQQMMVSVERINQYIDNKQENLNIIPNNKLEINQIDQIKFIKPEIIYQQKQDDNAIIQFRNVFMTYDAQFDESSKLALKDINFSIKRGEKVAFVGRTGSGKTSILNALFRLYEYQYGQITINNQDIKQISLLELRQQMSVVPQFGFLYNASIKDNLDPENKCTQEEIEQLFTKIGFKFRGISEQQQNTSFMVQPNGSNLSNGEKQIINFIRIILQNKQIVCLDEATSNMDPNTDQLLHNLLFKYVEDKTLIVITHRLENISKYDKIIVMDQGQIVEMGSYEQLNNIQDGFFHKLILHQNK